MDHKQKNVEARKQRQKSKRAQLRQLQQAYNYARFRERKLEQEVEDLKLEIFSLKYNIK